MERLQEPVRRGTEREEILQRLRSDAVAAIDAFQFAHDTSTTTYLHVINTAQVVCRVCPTNRFGFPKALTLAGSGDLGNIFSHLKTGQHKKVGGTHDPYPFSCAGAYNATQSLMCPVGPNLP